MFGYFPPSDSATTQAKVVASLGADVSVVNTTTETTLASLTLPGGSVAAGDVLRLIIGGTIHNSSGGSVVYTFAFKLGATTVLTGAVTAGSVAGASNVRKWLLEVDLLIVSTTAQRAVAAFVMGSATSISLSVASSAVNTGSGVGVATENTATDKNCVVSVAMDTANANANCVATMANLVLVKKAS